MAGLMREVHIRPVFNGFVVSVGCQTLVFNSIGEVAAGLIDYQKDPEAATKKYIEKAVNPTLDHPGLAVASCPPPMEAGQYGLVR